MNLFANLLPTIQRYSISNQKEQTDGARITVMLAFIHVVFFAWFWVVTDRAVPEYIFLAFSGIVIGGLGFDAWRSNTININQQGSRPDIDNPDQ